MRRCSTQIIFGMLLCTPLYCNWALADLGTASPVIAAAIERGPVTYQVSTYGTLSPKIEELSFKIGGRIARFEVEEGARADIRFAPYPGVNFEGELTKLARIANPGDALYTAEITISAGDYSLRPGMVAEVDLYHTSDQNYSLVPFDALVDLRGRRGNIYVLNDSRSAVQQVSVTLVSVQGLQAALKEDLDA